MVLQLLTIPVSHYCEKARWALERAQIPFEERPSIQFFHYWDAWRSARTFLVPVLLTPSGAICDSTEILHYADRHAQDGRAGIPEPLFPEGPQRQRVQYWEERFDAIIGVEARRWMYWVTLSDISNERLLRFIAHGVPRWQRVVGRYVLPFAKRYARWRLDVTRANVDAGMQQVKALFAEVSAALEDGRRFLVGEHFSAADLTFASLSALVLLPPNYGVPMFEPHELPSWARDTVDELRATRAGRYALRLYEERGAPGRAPGDAA